MGLTRSLSSCGRGFKARIYAEEYEPTAHQRERNTKEVPQGAIGVMTALSPSGQAERVTARSGDGG